MNLTVAGTSEAVLMVEAGAQEVSEEVMLGGILFAHEELKKIVAFISGIVAEIGKPKKEFPLQLPGDDVKAAVREYALPKVEWMFETFERSERNAREEQVKAEVAEHFAEQFEGREVEVVLGAQTASMMVTRDDYASLLGRDPIVATDDGSLGYAGFCTEPVREELARGDYSAVYCCGPTPLMRAVAAIAEEAGVPCWVSMEKRMACGVGACLSCVVETQAGKRRSCVDGPVFNAKELVW